MRKYTNTIPTGTTGAICELLVAADLMRLGFNVFRALSPSCPCDLIITKGGFSKRIEVTKATRSKNGKAYFSKHDTQRHDVMALVFESGIIEYTPETFLGVSTVYLDRFFNGKEATKANQRPVERLEGVRIPVQVFPLAVERPANATGPLRSLSVPDSAMWEEPTP